MASDRRDAIDVARILALLMVVLGHLSLAVVDRHAGHVRGANLLALHPEWAWLAAAAPMPVFFAAAGWANATTSAANAAPRIRTLVGVATTVIVAWSFGVLLATAIAGDPGVVADGARVATQPAWFLAAYAPFAALGATLGRIARTKPIVLTVGGALVVLALSDLARFGFNAPQWTAWPGFFLAWVIPWLLGAWWREQHAKGFAEQRVGALLAVGAGLLGVVLVNWFGYVPQLIDAISGKRSNTTPPTLYTAVAAVAQVGIFMLLAPSLDRAGRRWRRLWDRAGEAAVGVYLWHLSALALCGGVIALGLPTPERLTTAWWLTRPLWWGAVIGVALVFVLATDAARRRLRKPQRATNPLGWPVITLAVLLTTAGAALVGLRGPRSVPFALECSALFFSAWLALRPRRA